MNAVRPTDGADFRIDDQVQQVNDSAIGTVKKIDGALIGVEWKTRPSVVEWFSTQHLWLLEPRSAWVALKLERPAKRTLCVVRCENGRKFLAVADPDWSGGFCQRNHYTSRSGRAMFKDTELGSPVTHWFSVPELPDLLDRDKRTKSGGDLSRSDEGGSG